MPNIHIEYSANLNQPIQANALMHAINTLLINQFAYDANSIKTRASVASNFLIGQSNLIKQMPLQEQAFIHIKISLLPNKDTETKQAISQQVNTLVLNYLQSLNLTTTQNATQICVEILEIMQDFYTKTIV